MRRLGACAPGEISDRARNLEDPIISPGAIQELNMDHRINASRAMGAFCPKDLVQFTQPSRSDNISPGLRPASLDIFVDAQESVTKLSKHRIANGAGEMLQCI